MKLLENLERERQKIVPPPASSIFLLSLQFTRGRNAEKLFVRGTLATPVLSRIILPSVLRGCFLVDPNARDQTPGHSIGCFWTLPRFLKPGVS